MMLVGVKGISKNNTGDERKRGGAKKQKTKKKRNAERVGGLGQTVN